MDTLNLKSPVIKEPQLVLTIVLLLLVVALLQLVSEVNAVLFLVAVLMGYTLFQSSFSFSAAYRNLFLKRDTSGARSHVLLLGLTLILFAPFLSGAITPVQPLGGAFAPVSVSMAFGAFIFGIGMPLGGACASGTLYTVGSGNPRSVIVLVFFCAGAFWGSLDLGWWQSLPGIGVVSFGREFGWTATLTGQLLGLVIIYLLLAKLHKPYIKAPLQKRETAIGQITRGPWPLVAAILMLAFLNLTTLLIAGHPWTITWGFTLWAAKVANGLGWVPLSSGFWSSGYAYQALTAPLWMDGTSVMNGGILGGAMVGMWARGGRASRWDRKLRPILAAMLGGLLLGYGARLAYGCNIGAFVSGIASGSLHGWIWILCALPGNWIGTYLRPVFGLRN